LDILHLNDPDDDCVINLDTAQANKNSVIKFSDPDAQGRGMIQYNHTTDSLRTTVAGTERMRIDSSGNVGLGTTSPSSYDSAQDNLVIAGTGNEGMSIISGTNSNSTIAFGDGTGSAGYQGMIAYLNGTGGDAMTFRTSAVERMRIDSSGDVQIGKTDGSQNTQGIILNTYGTIRANSQAVEALHLVRSTAGNIARFWYNNTTLVGNINVTSSSTAYNTSSDYRLKENVVPMTGSIDRLKALKPSRFNFITDPDTTVDGFLAHEAQEVVPEAVTGDKDAMTTEEYEVTPAVEAVMGEREVEDYQGIDQAKLVPLLVSALQEAVARIEQLENK